MGSVHQVGILCCRVTGTTLDKGRDTLKGYVVYSKGKPLRMNENKIRKDLSLLGLYGIITSVKSPKDKDAKPYETLSSLQVAEQDQSLTRIEDCFRVMKSAFNLRPVFVHKGEHIYGHVHLCVLSLILLRLLEKQLKNKKTLAPMKYKCTCAKRKLNR